MSKSKYFENVSSLDALKKEYRVLLKENHPDNGGDESTMQEINTAYEALFPIFKERQEKETGVKVEETAESTRRQFYTQNGWEGSRHDWNRTLKEVAQIVRTYVKEKYPTYKFSVRTSYASMCQELHVDLKESPCDIYKSYEELTREDKSQLINRMIANHLFTLMSWSDDELKAEFERIWDKEGNFYKCMNEVTQAVVNDVDEFVNSYNYSDCDGMIDHFHVDFYYFGCCQNNGIRVKIVPRTPRIKERGTQVRTAFAGDVQPEEYSISPSVHTKTGEKIWLVNITRSLSRDEYMQEKKKMKELDGYYSKFTHSFVFKYDPTEMLGRKGA